MIFDLNEIIKKAPAELAHRHRKAIKKLKAKLRLPSPAHKEISARKKIHKKGTVRRRKIRRQKDKASLALSSIHSLDKNSAKTLLSLLYWTAGSKYPASNFVSFSHSDAALVKTFLILLRKTFRIENSKIKIHLQLYSSHNRKKVVQFWSKLLNVPPIQFYKPTITNPKQKSVSKNYFGTCSIRYYSLDLLHKIMGLYSDVNR